MNIKRVKEVFLILLLALSVTALSSSGFLAQYFRRPDNHVFIGVSHYWEDFFYYLDQFYQGSSGNWLTINRFSTEPFPPTVFYFNHILLGKLMGFFGMASFESYNSAVITVKFLFITMSYLTLALVVPRQYKLRLLAFCIFLFSSNFPLFQKNGEGLWVLQDLPVTRTAAPFLERFGNIPNTLMIDTTFLISIIVSLLIFSKFRPITRRLSIRRSFFYMLSLNIPLALLSIGDAAKTVILVLSLIIMVLVHRPEKLSRTIITQFLIIILPILFVQLAIFQFLSKSLSDNPVYRYTIQWNIENQGAWSNQLLRNPLSYLHSFGLILIPFLAGFITLIRLKRTPSLTLLLAVTTLSAIFYHLPIESFLPLPRFRFIFPAVYVGVAAVAAIGFSHFLKYSYLRRVLPLLVMLFFTLNFVSIIASMRTATVPLSEPDFHFAYIPNQLYLGLKHLEALPHEDSNVLANPTTSMDILLPGLTGKRTYSGHMLTTHDISRKDALAQEYFRLQMDAEQSKRFLIENKITYVMVTMYDGDSGVMQRRYPYLTIVFQNDGMTIFKP